MSRRQARLDLHLYVCFPSALFLNPILLRILSSPWRIFPLDYQLGVEEVAVGFLMKRFIYGLCLYGRGESFGNRGFPDLLPSDEGVRFSRIYYIGKRGNNNSNDNNNNNDNTVARFGYRRVMNRLLN